jgi:hypothetical protein
MALLFDRRGSITLQHPWHRLFFRQVEVSIRPKAGPTLVLLGLDGEEVSIDPERVVKVELEPDLYRPGRTLLYRRARTKFDAREE